MNNKDNHLYDTISELPPLPKTIIDLEQLRQQSDYEIEDLVTIVERDPILVANILKVANSARYGYSGKVKNLKMALNILGFNMVLNIAIGSTINNTLKPNLEAYGINSDLFMEISLAQSILMGQWEDKQLRKDKSNLQLAAFLQEVGKIVVTMMLKEKGLLKEFKERLQGGESSELLEREYLGHSSVEITALVFSHWKLHEKLIDYIKKSDSPKEAPIELKLEAYALRVIRVLIPISAYVKEEEKILEIELIGTESDLEKEPLARLVERSSVLVQEILGGSK